MVAFEWHDLKLTVREMSRAAALDCAREFATLIELGITDQSVIANEQSWLYVHYAPVSIACTGKVLDVGTHTIEDGVTLTLPLTRAGFDALPISLTAHWSNAAEEANRWLTDFFIANIKALRRSLIPSAPALDKPPS